MFGMGQKPDQPREGESGKTWLYLRHKPNGDGTSQYYAGKTKRDNVRHRNSSSMGELSTGMYDEVCAVQVPNERAHVEESSAIQFIVAFFGRKHVSNKQQCEWPITGWKWDE